MTHTNINRSASFQLARIVIAALAPVPGEDPAENHRRVVALDVDINHLDTLVTIGRMERKRLQDPNTPSSLMLAPYVILADAVDDFLERCFGITFRELVKLGMEGNEEARLLLCAHFQCTWPEFVAIIPTEDEV